MAHDPDNAALPAAPGALAALAAGERSRAAALLAESDDAEHPLLADALREHLRHGDDHAVYDQPAAFEAFIRSGGNVELYESVSDRLAETYARTGAATLLDIGCGDGLAIVAALVRGRSRVTSVSLVEPSSALLEQAVARLSAEVPDVEVRPSLGGVETFLADSPDEPIDLVESTFALHTLPPAVRDTALRQLARLCGTIAIAEFDVPEFERGGPDHVRFLAGTYERGLAEYDDDRHLVAQGFLMPVLTGQLAPGAKRVTWEQPAGQWRTQVERCGFTDVVVRPLTDYWSSPAFLLTGRGAFS